MTPLHDVELPPKLTLTSVERNTAGETNAVYFCHAIWDGRPCELYIKVARATGPRLAHERRILTRLAGGQLPVPRVLWYGRSPRDVLILEALPGQMIWDYIDPRRPPYEPERALLHLRAYGACLARIHALPLGSPPCLRPRLHELIGEESLADARFAELVAWLHAHRPIRQEHVFVHGDLNTASVLVESGVVSGVVDWEFAGIGWREYDLAWVLRARTAFLNTVSERAAVLQGYTETATFDAHALRYCEVLNYLHFAYWDRVSDPGYTAFALTRAAELAGLSPQRTTFC